MTARCLPRRAASAWRAATTAASNGNGSTTAWRITSSGRRAAGKLQGRDVVFAGSLPAHLYISEDKGETWRELPALRNAEASKWTFPPPPRIGHIKDIVLDGDRLLVGIEIGALLVSKDFGESFVELPVDPDPQECDIHRILVHPARPDRIIIANGIVGMMASEEAARAGGATRCRDSELPRRDRDPSRPARSAVHVGGRRLAVALV